MSGPYLNKKGLHELVTALREADNLRTEVSALRTRAEAAERERDEYKECYRLAMVSVNDAYDKGYAAGQRDMRKDVETVLLGQGYQFEPVGIGALRIKWAKAVAALPIKERP